MEQYPHIRILEGSDKLIQSSAYRKILEETKAIPLTTENYQAIRNKIYDVA